VSVDHYENFPVASWLCPSHLRDAVRAIYAFARTADDLADEGHDPPALRLARLTDYRQALQRCEQGLAPQAPWQAVFAQLGPAIRRHDLPTGLLHDLLDAFCQDTANPIYADRVGLLAYCSKSANPVGRLMLHLAGVNDAISLAQSDDICSALQLINFWQDPSVDLARQRCYFTREDARAHGIDLDQGLPRCEDTPCTQAMVQQLCQWAFELMCAGAPLALRVPGRFGWELRLVVQGGLRILERIQAMDFRTLSARPRLGAGDAPLLLWRALRMSATQPAPGMAHYGRRLPLGAQA